MNINYKQFKETENSEMLQPKYTWEVKDVCKQHKRNYTSNEVNGYLKYLVVRKLLKSKKRPIKLRNGEFGERLVDFFLKK